MNTPEDIKNSVEAEAEKQGINKPPGEIVYGVSPELMQYIDKYGEAEGLRKYELHLKNSYTEE